METGLTTASSDEAKQILTKEATSIAVGQKGSFRESARVDMGANHTDVNNIIPITIGIIYVKHNEILWNNLIFFAGKELGSP